MYNQSRGAIPCKILNIMKKDTYKTQITRLALDEGESIEQLLRRLTANNEPIPQNVPPIYTPKDEGVMGDYNIRHDRFDTAYEATDKFSASKQAQGANKGEMLEKETTKQEE